MSALTVSAKDIAKIIDKNKSNSFFFEFKAPKEKDFDPKGTYIVMFDLADSVLGIHRVDGSNAAALWIKYYMYEYSISEWVFAYMKKYGLPGTVIITSKWVKKQIKDEQRREKRLEQIYA